MLALEETYAPYSLLFPIELAIQQKEERGEEELSREELVVLAVEALEREVNNGGYGQFFVNSSRVYTPLILSSLSRIGCPETGKITEKALQSAGLSGLTGKPLIDALESYQRAWYERNKSRITNYSEIAQSAEKDATQSTIAPNSVDWNAIDKLLDECDQMFYRYPEPIGDKLFQFIKENRASIRF